MAKTDSFFIRITKDLGNTNTYHEKAIPIGAFVDPLGKSVLRILNIHVAITDNTGRSTVLVANGVAATQYQLLTQTQTDIVLPSDKAVIASGRVIASNRIGAQGLPSNVSQDFDILPQNFTGGYLIGVDTLYLGGAASQDWVGDQYVTLVMECQVETLTKEAAVALALSQQ
jgi:hypothetical protein